MYQTDFVCTYRRLLEYSVCDGSNNECEGDSDRLYQLQFLQAFGCEDGYDDSKISTGLTEVRQTLEAHAEGRAFLDKAYEQGLPPQLAIFASLGGEGRAAFLDTIVRTYYGWPTMDVMHAFVCKVKNNPDAVTSSDWDGVIKQHKKLYA